MENKMHGGKHTCALALALALCGVAYLGNPCMGGQTVNTALFQAVKQHDVAAVRELLQKGADANATGEGGTHVLVAAAGYGSSAVVQLLLSHGANVNVREQFGLTALEMAAHGGYLAVVKTLVEHGADVNACGEASDVPGILGNTMLMAAMDARKTDVIRFLLDKGARIDLPNHSGQTPLLLACLLDRPSLARFFLSRGASVKVADDEGMTPFLAACSRGWTGFARLLVKRGANIRDRNKAGADALMLSAEARKAVDCERWLLSLGLSPNARDNLGATALMYAAENCRPANVRLLLGAGAPVYAADTNGRTALMRICWYGQDDVIPDKGENEAVADILHALIARGADVAIKDNEGKTALWYAGHGVHRELVVPLRTAGAKE